MQSVLMRITQATDLDEQTATKAIGAILQFLRKEGPPETEQLIQDFPGAADAIALAGEPSGGLMSMFGGVMALGQHLMALGVPMDKMQPLGRELFAIGREIVGEDEMGTIVGAIPGLSQFS